MAWYEHRASGPLLRIGGAVLLLLAYACGRALRAHAIAGGAEDDALAYLLALLTFLCATSGAALLFVGRHLFDRIEIAERWRRRD